MIIKKDSGEFCLTNDLPEDSNARMKAIKDRVFSTLLKVITAALRDLIYHPDAESRQTTSLKETEEGKYFLVLYVSQLTDEKNILSKFLVKLVA